VGKATGKPMGRPPGSKNLKSILAREALEKLDVDLIKAILSRIGKLPIELQVKYLVDLMPYVYPKLTSVDINLSGGDGDRPLKEVADADLDAILVGDD